MASKSSDNSEFKNSDSNDSFPDFYPLRMTADHRTEMYVKFAKVMLIFQGPITDKRRGAVKELTSKFNYAGRLISDETYTKETTRVFSEYNTEEFYRYFRSRAKKSCEDGYNLIVIDQSMNNAIQLKYYFYLAQKMQYLIVPYPPLLIHDKNKIKFNTQAHEFRRENWRTGTLVNENLFKPLFCGWFLHDVDSVELRDEANLYVQDLFDNIPEFREIYSKICDPSEFKSCYNMMDKRQNLAFCTAKIFHNILDTKSYMSDSSFKKAYGSMSKLFVVGFVISPHMIAARIRLTFEQKKLWQMPDDLEEKVEMKVFPSSLLKSTKVNMPDEEVTLIASKSNRTLISGERMEVPTEAIQHRARARSAHILLGKVEGAPLRNVDYDVPFAVCRERNVLQKYSDEVRPYDLDRCLVRRIGKYWFIYLKESLVVNGLFTSCNSIEN